MKDNQANAPKTKYLKDYKEPEYRVDTADLEFDLDPETTRVKSTLKIRSDYDRSEGVRPLVLDGDELDFVSVAVNGRKLNEDEYKVDEKGLTILNPPAEFTVTIENDIHPIKNTKLEGLYVSSGNFCTQCEPEGFRRITYYPDHPDVMAKFTTLVKGDKEKLPILLSNGNPIEKGELEDGRHFMKWEDPFPKPSYLFALVGGDLARIQDKFLTMSGREVELGIYVEHGKENKAHYAMDALKRSMKWDEEKWGREYDLDLFNIVAVSDFNFGAMENKGLNIFNDKVILADPKTATDLDYFGIERVVAHEYFHNWTGDRVTVKNWFNLTLKEGLTVFRDQNFSADMRSRPVQRIDDVQTLRAAQFSEDAGPLAHPIKPKSYVAMTNFYTSTIYKKGAEIIRMTKNLLGAEAFRKATDLYFERHDGKAVTTEEWLKSMEDASGFDLKQFRRWYDQAGTPTVTAEGKYNKETKTYELILKQNTKPTPGQPTKLPFMMPVEVGLLGADGKDMPLKLDGEKGKAETSKVLVLKDNEQKFVFTGVEQEPVLSVNRGFTAPVNMVVNYTAKERAHLMSHDSDAFNRFEVGQQYAVSVMKSMIKDIEAGKEPKIDKTFVKAFGSYLKDDKLEKAFVAKAITLPSESFMAQQVDVVNVDAINQARKTLSKAIADTYSSELVKLFDSNSAEKPFEPTAEQAGERALKNSALGYIAKFDNDYSKKLLSEQYNKAGNMTDEIAGLSIIVNSNNPDKQVSLDKFYNKYQGQALVTNKWLTVQASADSPTVLDDVKKLTEHEAFDIKNPNKVMALVGAFAGNAKAFHAIDGSGYEFVADFVKKYDEINPMTAAKLTKAFGDWRKFDKERQEMMKAALKEIMDKPNLSKNVYEIVSKSLASEEEKANEKKQTIAKKKETHKKVSNFGSGEVKAFVSGAKKGSKLSYPKVKELIGADKVIVAGDKRSIISKAKDNIR